jgi:hypothetical protein
MKTCWNGELPQGVEVLSMKDESSVVGGESLWFWVGFGAGLAVNMFTHTATNPSGG